jgi:hypothetical protein
VIDKKWLDKNGLVRTKEMFEDSGNGAAYSCLANILCEGTYIPLTRLWDAKRGVLVRTPQNTYGNESWDNYLAVAVYCLMFNKRWARVILWSAIKKLGFMQNSFEKGDLWRSQMFRFPVIWVVMIAAAFKIIAPLSRLILQAMCIFHTLNLADASGTQLQFLQRWAIYRMGNPKPMKKFLQSLKDQGTSMKEVMTGYWQEGHPVLDGYDKFEKMLLHKN